MRPVPIFIELTRPKKHKLAGTIRELAEGVEWEVESDASWEKSVYELPFTAIGKISYDRGLLGDAIRFSLKNNGAGLELPAWLPPLERGEFEVGIKKKHREDGAQLVKDIAFSLMRDSLDEMLDLTDPAIGRDRL